MAAQPSRSRRKFSRARCAQLVPTRTVYFSPDSSRLISLSGHRFEVWAARRDLVGWAKHRSDDTAFPLLNPGGENRRPRDEDPERPWHHSQVLAPGPDSEWHVELTLKVALTPELIRWIFGYDQDARVIEPAVLRDSIAKKANGIRANTIPNSG